MDGTCENRTEAYLHSLGREFPYIPGGQQMIAGRSFGACCDPTFADAPSALLVERYSTVFIKMARDAGTGDLILTPPSANTPPQFFACGKGDPGTPAGIWGLTNDAQSNLFPGGATVDRGQQFLVFGHSFELAGTFIRGGSGIDSDPQVAPAWVFQGDASYERRIVQSVLSNISVTFTFGNTNVRYLMGALLDWPSMTGLYGSQAVGIGQPIVGNYKAYTAVLLINARDEGRKLTVNLAYDKPITVSNSPGLDTVTDVYLAVKMRAYGVPICAPDNPNICNAPSGPVQGDLRQIIREEIRKAVQGQ